MLRNVEMKFHQKHLLYSPMTVCCLILLIVNDHFLKGCVSLHPVRWLTGKLSDFAGALLLPAFIEFSLYVFFNISKKAARNSAFFSSMAILILIKLSFWFNSTIVMIGNAPLEYFSTAYRINIVRDMTDLMALPMLLIFHKYSTALEPANKENANRME
ncbi:MAG: hypothetical protein HQK54_10835 [Oligoflexales bacterium]|nr:hypothetical protein [Oligoflexales bacterium]